MARGYLHVMGKEEITVRSADNEAFGSDPDDLALNLAVVQDGQQRDGWPRSRAIGSRWFFGRKLLRLDGRGRGPCPGLLRTGRFADVLVGFKDSCARHVLRGLLRPWRWRHGQPQQE